jgi:hypothetical protein
MFRLRIFDSPEIIFFIIKPQKIFLNIEITSYAFSNTRHLFLDLFPTKLKNVGHHLDEIENCSQAIKGDFTRGHLMRFTST